MNEGKSLRGGGCGEWEPEGVEEWGLGMGVGGGEGSSFGIDCKGAQS